MKKIKIVMCICLAAVIISGCSDKGKGQKDSNPSGQDFVLTEEQKNYLSDKKGIGTAALELMNKESVGKSHLMKLSVSEMKIPKCG